MPTFVRLGKPVMCNRAHPDLSIEDYENIIQKWEPVLLFPGPSEPSHNWRGGTGAS